MPGKTIGTHLNPMPELVWQGHIVIHNVAGEFDLQYQFERGDPSADKIIREHIQKAIQELSKRL